jgi:UDP-N-acetylmuramoyl-L-alanyl-D-glutamate--2,6-diaminopimelate ligase
MSARLSQLLDGICAVSAAQDRDVGAVCVDSRESAPGSLFLAVAGLTTHGLAFTEAALAAGAVALCWEPAPGQSLPALPAGFPAFAVPGLGQQVGRIAARAVGDPSAQMRVLGVTGTNGKTSISQIYAQALTDAGERCGVLGTLGYGLYGALSAGEHTTPDAVRVQQLLAGFRAAGAGHAALEVSSHALDQGRVAGVRFQTAVFTNLTRDHLDYHGDLEAYAAAKRKLFRWPELGVAVVNADDAIGRTILAELPGSVRAVAYGLDANEVGSARASVRVLGRRLALDATGLRVAVESDFGSGELRARLLGRFNAANLLAVLGALAAGGMPFARALELLAAARTVPGRMECFGGHGGPLVVVDYAHTPDALGQVLLAARPHSTGRLVCVFGCGGDRDQGKRPQMGAVAAAHADQVVLTDDNPRTEDPDRIVAEIAAGVAAPQRAKLAVERDRAKAIAGAVAAARAGDVVLVAGKGHEDYQIVGRERRPYSDRATVARLTGDPLPERAGPGARA